MINPPRVHLRYQLIVRAVRMLLCTTVLVTDGWRVRELPYYYSTSARACSKSKLARMTRLALNAMSSIRPASAPTVTARSRAHSLRPRLLKRAVTCTDNMYRGDWRAAKEQAEIAMQLCRNNCYAVIPPHMHAPVVKHGSSWSDI